MGQVSLSCCFQTWVQMFIAGIPDITVEQTDTDTEHERERARDDDSYLASCSERRAYPAVGCQKLVVLTLASAPGPSCRQGRG